MLQKKQKPANTSSRYPKGASKITASKKFSLKKYLPVIVLVSIVGGFLVWRSFADTKLYPYQYSVYSCQGFSKSKINPDDKCLGESAEALTYRLYKAVLGRAPEFSSSRKDKNGKPLVPGYQYWVQKFAGDREQPSIAGKQFASASKYASSKSNQAFVEDLYKNLYGKKGDAKGIKYWKSQLDSKKKYSKGTVAMYFVLQQSAITAQKANVANYIASASTPKVVVVQTAQEDQDVRLVKATKSTGDAKSQYNTISSYVKNAQKNRDSSKAIASKSAPSRANLTEIATQEKSARAYFTKTLATIKKIKANTKTSKSYYDRARERASYSPDISADKIKIQYDKAVVYLASAEKMNKDIDKIIKGIVTDYKTAERKYEAEQKRLAAVEASRCKSGTDYNGASAGCGTKPNNGGGSGSGSGGSGSGGGSTGGGTGGSGGGVTCANATMDDVIAHPELINCP